MYIIIGLSLKFLGLSPFYKPLSYGYIGPDCQYVVQQYRIPFSYKIILVRAKKVYVYISKEALTLFRSQLSKCVSVV